MLSSKSEWQKAWVACNRRVAELWEFDDIVLCFLFVFVCEMQTLIISFSYWLVVDGIENYFGVRMLYFQFVVDSWEWLKKELELE